MLYRQSECRALTNIRFLTYSGIRKLQLSETSNEIGPFCSEVVNRETAQNAGCRRCIEWTTVKRRPKNRAVHLTNERLALSLQCMSLPSYAAVCEPAYITGFSLYLLFFLHCAVTTITATIRLKVGDKFDTFDIFGPTCYAPH